jgi:acyl-coenzyme A thioesterase PaaI-like protein
LTSEVRAAPVDRRAPPSKRDREGAIEFEPHHCFACGELNEDGLRLQLHTSPEGSWTEVVLEPRFQGWGRVAHGGIVRTLLDEVMAWSVIGRGTWGVTARLNVAFRRPISMGRSIQAEGWVVEEHRRAHRTAGRVLDAATGEVLATADGTFIAVPGDQLERLKAKYGMRRIPGPSPDAADDTTDAVDASTSSETPGQAVGAGARAVWAGARAG